MTLIRKDHIKYLKKTLESNDVFSYPDLYDEVFYDTKDKSTRYNILKLDTSFFTNIIKLQAFHYTLLSVDEWHMQLDLRCIPQCVADFEICYCWMCPSRWFSYDMKDPDVQKRLKGCFLWNLWKFVDERYKMIESKSLPICSVDDFINFKFIK